ncbi:MAG: radical SAM protein, partial [Candidatus Aenigmarchaeota archaeon]|nr:radical SAM protein [Candidatus Aenigmarchaeota archaeon]
KSRAVEFSQRLKELKLDVDWCCAMRVPRIDIDTLKMMKDAGCTFIGYGFESASQKVLNSMKKKINIGQIRNAIELTERAGLGVQANFIYGDPAETRETMKETSEFFNRYCRDHIVHNGFIIPFPGSEVFEHCIRERIIDDRHKYYDTIHKMPIYNMTEMDDDIFLGLLKPILVDTKYKVASIIADTESEKIRIHATCPHCNSGIEYVFPTRYDIIYSSTARAFCSQCHKRFNIPTTPLLKPTMKNFLKQRKIISLLRTLRMYLKRLVVRSH